jgi:arsenite methyltransferase
MDLRAAFQRRLAKQLGHPTGLGGRIVAARINRRNVKAVDAAVAALEIQEGQVVADVGFGGGIGLTRLLQSPAAVVHGVEISEDMLRAAGKTYKNAVDSGRLVLHPGPMSAIPLPGESLDGIVTTNTIYFVDDLAPAFTELRRVLKPGGRLVIGIGDPDHMSRLPFTPYGFRLRPVNDVVQQLAAAGLTLADHRRLGPAEGPQHLRIFHLLIATPPAAAPA